MHPNDQIMLAALVTGLVILLLVVGIAIYFWSKRNFRFRLRTAFVIVALICVGLALLQVFLLPQLRHRWAIHVVQQYRGSAEFYPESRVSDIPWPWIESSDPESNPYNSAHIVELPNDQAISAAGYELRYILGLERLYLGSDVTDAGLQILVQAAEESGLKVINIDLIGSRVTVQGLRHLKAFELEGLWVWDINLTDSDLVEISEWKNLRELWLIRTAVTTDGIAQLRKALPNAEIVFRPHNDQPSDSSNSELDSQ